MLYGVSSRNYAGQISITQETYDIPEDINEGIRGEVGGSFFCISMFVNHFIMLDIVKLIINHNNMIYLSIRI